MVRWNKKCQAFGRMPYQIGVVGKTWIPMYRYMDTISVSIGRGVKKEDSSCIEEIGWMGIDTRYISIE